MLSFTLVVAFLAAPAAGLAGGTQMSVSEKAKVVLSAGGSAMHRRPSAIHRNSHPLKKESQRCSNKHGKLLETIKTELKHLKKHGVNASGLDQLYWPKYLRSAGEDVEDESNDRPFFQIHKGKLYVHSDSFRSKKRSTPWLHSASGVLVRNLCAVLHTYPDLPPIRLMVNDRDRTEGPNELPVFVPWKVKSSMPILYPQFASVEIEEPAWKDKYPKAFFAGAASDNDAVFALTRTKRSQMQELFDHDPGIRELMDVQNASQQFCDKQVCTLKEQARWKYQLVMDGIAGQQSLITSLSMHSVVLKPRSPYYEFFEPALVEYEHVVPVNLTDLESSASDLKSKIKWVRQHDTIAKGIAERGARFAKQHLQADGLMCYFLELLLQYHELMHFDDTLPTEFASSPDLCTGL